MEKLVFGKRELASEPPGHRELWVGCGGAVGGCLEEARGVRCCGGWWCMGFQIRVLAEGRLVGEGGGLGEFRECQLRAELGCGGASRWTLCVDNTV